jgi:GNAT superfamily N-acetyltransferase
MSTSIAKDAIIPKRCELRFHWPRSTRVQIDFSSPRAIYFSETPPPRPLFRRGIGGFSGLAETQMCDEMMNDKHITVRDAAEFDIPALTAIKGEGTEPLHRDRLRDAQSADLRYLVLVVQQELIGYACLVFRRPASWSDADDTTLLPHLDDLRVSDAYQGQGYGSAFIRAIERIAAASGAEHLYLRVEPEHNPRAYALYQRLGYQQLQNQPYLIRWAFTDSAGMAHWGEDWVVDMVKELLPRAT